MPEPKDVNLKFDEKGRAAFTEVLNITDVLCAEFTKLMDKNVTRNLEFATLLGDLVTKNRAMRDKLNKKQPIPEKDLAELVSMLESAHTWLKSEKLSTTLLDVRKRAGNEARRLHDAVYTQVKDTVQARRASAAPTAQALSEKEQLALASLFQQKVDELHQYAVQARQNSKVQHPSFWEKLKQYTKAAGNFLKAGLDKLLRFFGLRKDKPAELKHADPTPQGRMAAAGMQAAGFAQGNVSKRVAAIEEREARRKQQEVPHKPTLTNFGKSLKRVSTPPRDMPNKKNEQHPVLPPRGPRGSQRGS